MRRIFLMLALLAPLAIAAGAGATENGLARAMLEARLAQIEAHGQKAMVEMNGTPTCLQGQGIATSESARGLKDQFLAKMALLRSAAQANDTESFNQTLSEMRGIANGFRDEVRAATNEQERAMLRECLDNELEENEQELQQLNERACEMAGNANMLAVEKSMQGAESAIGRLEAKGIDTANLEAALERVRAKKAELGQRYSGCDISGARQASEEIGEEFEGMRSEATDAVIEKTNSTLENALEAIGRLENKGMNVSGVKAKLQSVAQLVQTAQTVCGDPERREECKAGLRDAQQQFGEAREGIIESVKDQLPDVAKERVENALGNRTQGPPTSPPRDSDETPPRGLGGQGDGGAPPLTPPAGPGNRSGDSEEEPDETPEGTIPLPVVTPTPLQGGTPQGADRPFGR